MSNSTSSTTTSFSVISPQSYLSPKHFLGDLFSHNLYNKLTTLHFDTIIYVDFEFQILLDSKTNCRIIGTKVSLNQNSMQMIVIKIRTRFFPPYYDLLIGWLTALDFYLFYRKHIRCHSVHYHPIQSM